MIRVTNLTKRYGARTAVDRVSFHVEKGSIVGFLGPNGAGKSTTIRVLTCYQPATSGSASVAGFDVFSQSMEVRRRIGYLPESAPLYPEMRVREYLNFRGKLRGMDLAERKSAIRSVIERCWLGEFIDRPIGQLSKGMKQRTGLADAIMHNPDVLILDEPTVGLDPTQIRETRNLIKDLGKRHTILLSSHILHELAELCTTVGIIEKGELLLHGSLSEIIQRARTGTKVHVRVTEQQDLAMLLLQKTKGIKGVELQDGKITVELERRTHDFSPLAKLLIDNNFKVREIREEEVNLETAFMRLTKGIVQ